MPSSMALATGRPDRFLALHYANNIWQRNIAEVMRTEYTDPGVFQQVVTFAEEQCMIPIRVQKEQSGHSRERTSRSPENALPARS